MRNEPNAVALTVMVVLTVVLAGTVTAQEVSEATPLAPSTPFAYQGRLLEEGLPANGSYDLQFRLFNAATTPPGTQIGATVVHENETVADGLFTVPLDFGGAILTNGPLWLEVGMRPGASGDSFTPLTPRQLLHPAPSAHYARAGVATDVQCAGCVGVGDLAGGVASSGRVLAATGASTMAWQAPSWTTGSGTAGQVAFWSAASALSGSAGLVWNSGSDRLETNTLALPETTSTAGRILLGGSVFLHGFGEYNTFLGNFAGNTTMTGGFNTGIGFDALISDTSGLRNTAIGANSLGSNTSGTDNSAVGASSLQENTTAKGNTAVGRSALRAQSYDNSGTAWDSLNTAVGHQALSANQPTSVDNGKENTAVGALALTANTTGAFNTAVGVSALAANTTGHYNSALGRLALSHNTSGIMNSAVGYFSLTANTKGSNNTALGNGSLASNTTASRNTAVGMYALASQNYSNASTAWDADNTAVGYHALNVNQPSSTSTGRGNTAIGSRAGESFTSADCTFLGYDADATVTGLANAMALGSGARVDASNKVVIGNTAVTSIGGYAAWSDYSDARGKRDVRDLDLGLDLILRLRPVEYRLDWGNGKLNFGFIAQEVEALLGEDINVVDVGGDPERTLALRYAELIAPLVKAVQEQQAEIVAQREALVEKTRRIERQDALIEELARRVATLEEKGAAQPGR